MLRFLLFSGCCVAMFLTGTTSSAQVDTGQRRLFADYFAAVDKAAHEGRYSTDVEQPRLNDAILYLRQGKFREAIRDCTRVLEHFVNHPKGLVILGMAAKLVKEPTLAIPYYERALQIYPQRALTQAQYGKYLAEIGKVEDGIARLQRALEVDPRLDPVYVWLARVYIQNKQPDLARQILQRRKEVEPLEAALPTEMFGVTKAESQGSDEKTSSSFADDQNGGRKGVDGKIRGEGTASDETNEGMNLYQMDAR